MPAVPTVEADPKSIADLAGQITGLARSFEAVRAPALTQCGVTGRASAEQAFEEFSRSWSARIGAMHEKVERLAAIVQMAADQYAAVDHNAASAAKTSGTIPAGTR